MATNDLTLDAGQLTAALAEPPTRRTFLVIHVEGEEASSTVVDVPEGGEVTIGRSRGATVVVDHEKVSRAPGGESFEVAPIYTLANGKIVRVDFVK